MNISIYSDAQEILEVISKYVWTKETAQIQSNFYLYAIYSILSIFAYSPLLSLIALNLALGVIEVREWPQGNWLMIAMLLFCSLLTKASQL